MSEEITNTEQLYLVSLELKAAKLQETIAKERRIAFEDRIIALMPDELKVNKGHTTLTLPDGSKIITKAGITVKADIFEIREIFEEKVWTDFPELPAPVYAKTAHTLDMDGYEWYRKNHPDIYNLIAEHVTVTPKKIGVELKPAKKEK